MDISTALAQLLEGHDIVVTISTRARSGTPAQDRPTADTSPSPTSQEGLEEEGPQARARSCRRRWRR
jgi:hypothetical protein